jgi:NAD(P)-dependent dehydrogenase (short-subunit alcohol dehydrogenase family)
VKDIAVVTGASRGIGAAICRRLSEGGLSVARLIRNADYEWIGENGEIQRKYGFDVAQSGDAERVFSWVESNFGTPTLLINCAGYVEPKSILEMTPEEWDYTLKVNLSGAFYCTQQFVKHLKAANQRQANQENKNSSLGRPGKIINIASTAGTRPSPGWSAYAAAKAGLINFSLTMTEELRPYNIKVYCVAPGRCATELRKKLAPDEDQSRIMQPEEVANFVYYLATQDNVLDGQVLTVARRGMDI